MFISKNTMTAEALKLVKVGEEYDREEIADTVAKNLAYRLYEELGGVKAMSLLDVESIKSGLYTAALSTIEWTKLNRKVEPEEYADSQWRLYSDPEERL